MAGGHSRLPEARWDILAQHVDQGASAYGRWIAAFDSPAFTLDKLARGFERQWLAHLDGLTVSTKVAAERYLTPELLEPEDLSSSRAVFAALGLLANGRQDLVESTLWADVPAVAAAAIQALTLAAPAGFDEWLASTLQSTTAAPYRRVLLALAVGRRLPVENLVSALQGDDPHETHNAAILARSSDPQRHFHVIEYLFDHEVEKVRDAALVTGLVYGSHNAVECCLRLASDGVRVNAHAMLLVALLGRRDDQRLLSAQLDRPTHRRAALFALGFSGYVPAVDHLLEHTTSPDAISARLAGEAIFAITGLDPSDERYVLPDTDGAGDEDDDESEAPRQPGDVDLALPNAPALRAWWQTVRARFDVSKRWVGGVVWSTSTVLSNLESASLRRRHALAQWLAIRTAGATQIPTRALTDLQRQELLRARGSAQ